MCCMRRTTALDEHLKLIRKKKFKSFSLLLHTTVAKRKKTLRFTQALIEPSSIGAEDA